MGHGVYWLSAEMLVHILYMVCLGVFFKHFCLGP